MLAGQFMDARNGRDIRGGIRANLELLGQMTDAAQVNSVPYKSTLARRRPIGAWDAGREARDLCRPGSVDGWVTKKEIAKLSHEAVADLDVSPNDPMWHTRATMENKRPDTWSDIENYINDGTTADLKEKKKFREKFPEFRYDLNRARSVLFWDDVKTTATSPKVNVTDAFGQDWKLKWGDEAVIEPIGNRLRVLLGAKFCDLTYTSTEGDSHLLILPSVEEKARNPEKAMPTTLEELRSVMLESAYEFDVQPFVLDSGVITSENASSLLRDLAPEAKKEYRLPQLLGRVWVSFKESMVEAKHDVLNSGGPVSQFTKVALGERAQRQAFVFSLWMEDKDNKEANWRATWVNDFAGRSGSRYVEFFHDPGMSFGGIMRAGEINRLKTGNQFNGFLWVNTDRTMINSTWFQIYRPGAWDEVTFADFLAGARHIARINNDDLNRVMESSRMPDFWRQAMVWRLAQRRDVIAKVFDIPAADSAGPAPTVIVPLTTRGDRVKAAEHYHVPLSEMENDLVRTGLLANDQRSGATSRPFLDLLVKEGKIQPCESTVLLGLLRDYRHPSGLVKRTYRKNDGDPWQSVRYQMPKK